MWSCDSDRNITTGVIESWTDDRRHYLDKEREAPVKVRSDSKTLSDERACVNVAGGWR